MKYLTACANDSSVYIKLVFQRKVTGDMKAHYLPLKTNNRDYFTLLGGYIRIHPTHQGFQSGYDR